MILDVCECEVATAHQGLTCNKEGWFVAKYQRHEEWIQGGGITPVSSAICCRPCIEDKLDANSTIIVNGNEIVHPVGLTTLNCHTSLGAEAEQQLLCNDQRSLLTGFEGYIGLATWPPTYQPKGPAQCCEAGLALDSGQVLHIKPCNCITSSGFNCGGNKTNYVMTGYTDFRRSALGSLIPVAPAQCCQMCLTDQYIDLDTCSQLNYCRGRGVCSMGSCDCHHGYFGYDCGYGQDTDDDDDDLPAWLLVFLVVCTCIVASLVFALVRTACEFYLRSRERQQENSSTYDLDIEQRLMFNEEGSAGSQDTESRSYVSTPHQDSIQYSPTNINQQDSQIQVVQQPFSRGRASSLDQVLIQNQEQISNQQQKLGSSQNNTQQQSQDQNTSSNVQPLNESTLQLLRRENSSDDQDKLQQQLQQNLRVNEYALQKQDIASTQNGGRAPHNTQAQSLNSEILDQSNDVDVIKKNNQNQSNAEGTQNKFVCTVCTCRPVQVVLIPCGHSNICRRCSRRMQQCPFCRQEIVRRQRVLLA